MSLEFQNSVVDIKNVRQVVRERNGADKEGYCGVSILGVKWHFDNGGIFAEAETFVGGVPARLADFPIRKVNIYDEGLFAGRILRAPSGYLVSENGAQAFVDAFSRQGNEFWRVRISAPTYDAAVALYKSLFDSSRVVSAEEEQAMREMLQQVLEKLQELEQLAKKAGAEQNAGVQDLWHRALRFLKLR